MRKCQKTPIQMSKDTCSNEERPVAYKKVLVGATSTSLCVSNARHVCVHAVNARAHTHTHTQEVCSKSANAGLVKKSMLSIASWISRLVRERERERASEREREREREKERKRVRE